MLFQSFVVLDVGYAIQYSNDLLKTCIFVCWYRVSARMAAVFAMALLLCGNSECAEEGAVSFVT